VVDPGAVAGSLDGAAMTDPGTEDAQLALQSVPAGGLADEVFESVAALDRGAPEPVEVGLTRPIDTAAGERGRAKTAPDGDLRGR
jgi:hypothetical protein